MVGLVVCVGEGHRERETRHLLAEFTRVPVRNDRIGSVQKPDLGQRDTRQAFGGFIQKQP